MAGYSGSGFDTLALHAGAAPDPSTGARAVPIHLTTSFVFESSDQAAALFNLERPGHVYSRISNPTNAVLEQRISALEGGIGAITTSSGQAMCTAASVTPPTPCWSSAWRLWKAALVPSPRPADKRPCT